MLKKNGGWWLMIASVVLAVGVVVDAGVWWAIVKDDERQTNYVTEVAEGLAGYYEDYEKEIPKADLVEGLGEIKAKNEQIKLRKFDEQKREAGERIGQLEKFGEIWKQLGEFLQDGILRLDAEMGKVEEMQQKTDELKEGYRGVLQGKLDTIKQQNQAIGDLRNAVRELFANDEMTEVSPDTTRAKYAAVVERVASLPQRELAESYTEALKKVDETLKQREKEAIEAWQRAVEAKRRADELRRQRREEEAAAWVAINVPYHSQNLQHIYNGCEAASMLMALQYKGRLLDVDLRRYAEMMPKSEDYNTGFVGSIYDLQPKTFVHWIAPAPLAKFGRESSGYEGVVDISGASLGDLINEVTAGNPVVVYATFLFNPLKEWLNGAPKNLHVMLLTGYNPKTDQVRVTDPWTQTDGGRTFDISRGEFEGLYDAVGRRAVVVR